MSLGRLLYRWRRRLGGAPRIRVRLLIRGRVGDGWYDLERDLALPQGATLSTLIEEADRRAIPLRAALEQSPHLRDTLMLNGERCEVESNLDRPLSDGDELYLLAPVAGGSSAADAISAYDSR